MDSGTLCRMKREVWVLRVGLGLLVVALAVAELPAQAPQNPPVATTSLTVVDTNGRTRIRLWVDGDTPRIAVLDDRGRVMDLLSSKVHPLIEH